MEFTGERVVPGKTPPEVFREHMDRYVFAAALANGRDTLDVACGTGYGTGHLLAAGAKRAVGVDISLEATRYARKYFGAGQGASYICADGIRLPFPSRVFDVIVSFETIEHVGDGEALVAEFQRVLREEGVLVCSTPNRKVFSPDSETPLNPYHTREFWPHEFKRLLRDHFDSLDLFGQCNVTLANNSVDRDGGVHRFEDDDRIISAYMIAVAGKGKRRSC